MRVLMITHVFPRHRDDHWGSFLLTQASALQADGVEVTVLAPHAAGLETAAPVAGIDVHRFRYAPAAWEHLAYRGRMHELVRGSWRYRLLLVAFLTAALWRAVCLSWRLKPNVIHAQWCLPCGPVAAVTAFLCRRPLVVSCLGTDVFLMGSRRLAARLAGVVLRRARWVTTPSSALRQELADAFPHLNDRLVVLPVPIREDLFCPRPEPTGPPVVLGVGRLSRQKGFRHLIAAMARLPADLRARLVLVGDGPEREPLHIAAAAAGVAEHVEFAGTVPPELLPPFLHGSVAVVLPSVGREGLGVALIEAQACGRTVIGSAVGGITDIIVDGETGLLVPSEDEAALAAAIQRLLTDPELRRRLAHQGRAHFETHFAASRLTAVLRKLYAKLTDRAAER